jgi:hypothetical protein
MVDINPAALSRPSISLSTPVLSKQSINVSVSTAPKPPKTSQLIPPRIDLEPIYTGLKASIGSEKWPVYKEAVTNFLIGNAPHVPVRAVMLGARGALGALSSNAHLADLLALLSLAQAVSTKPSSAPSSTPSSHRPMEPENICITS